MPPMMGAQNRADPSSGVPPNTTSGRYRPRPYRRVGRAFWRGCSDPTEPINEVQIAESKRGEGSWHSRRSACEGIEGLVASVWQNRLDVEPAGGASGP